ncbi:MAG: hypothetical protein IT448_09560 [Phycisphaerales bacterium]|nr:hypothetical protein [Phycisphaerales bacterium]
MISKDLEFRISQYIDDDLPSSQQAELRQWLETDSAAAVALEQYQKLNRLLKNVGPVPEVDYSALSARISDAVSACDAQPQILYSFKWVKQAVSVAVAACVVIAAGVWMSSSMSRSSRTLVQVELPRAETTAAPAVAQIHIGPSANSSSFNTNEAMVVKSTKLVIASVSGNGHDSSLPY